MFGLTKKFLIFITYIIFSLAFAGVVKADINVAILAVNGTDEKREREINFPLPQELKSEDILETAGLDVDYDPTNGTYFVHGNVTLDAKESKTLKIRVRDVWQFDPRQIGDIRDQIDASVKRLEGTEYHINALIKKENLNQRLEYILQQQAEAADNTQRRIDRYRMYADEIDSIRNDSISVKFWRAKPSESDKTRTIKLVINLENPSSEEPLKITAEQLLPVEVRGEHFVNLEGFEIGYNLERKQTFLTKEEELKPAEKKKYELNIIDMWNIPQTNIENLKDRTRKTFKLLENTEYGDSAKYLVASIKENLEKIEISQAEPREIKQHIGAFRANQKYFDKAKTDIKTLEELLEAVRENLERSKVKNVLQRIQAFTSITSIAEAIFGKKPAISNFWRIIIGIIIFVGVFTTIHFVIWGKRSKDVKQIIKEQEKKTA